jgi:hypothetical protein
MCIPISSVHVFIELTCSPQCWWETCIQQRQKTCCLPRSHAQHRHEDRTDAYEAPECVMMCDDHVDHIWKKEFRERQFPGDACAVEGWGCQWVERVRKAIVVKRREDWTQLLVGLGSQWTHQSKHCPMLSHDDGAPPVGLLSRAGSQRAVRKGCYSKKLLIHAISHADKSPNNCPFPQSGCKATHPLDPSRSLHFVAGDWELCLSVSAQKIHQNAQE